MQMNRPYSTTPMTRTDNVDVFNTVVLPNRMRRVSWGAILAGSIIALIIMFGLYMLGLAIGAASVNPARDLNPLEGVVTGTVIWLVATTLISLLMGGIVAGRLAGTLDETDGVLHGLVTWGVVTLVSLLLLTSSVGSLINGVTSAFASAVSASGQAVSEAAPEVAQALNLQDETMLTIQSEVGQLFGATAPAETTAEGEVVAQNGTVTNLDQLQVMRDIRAFMALNPDAITEDDRNQLATSIADRTNLSVTEARQQVDRWETFYMEVRQDAEATAREVGQSITDVITLLAGAIFTAMVVGAFAAGAGGYIGVETHEHTLESAAREVTDPAYPNATTTTTT